MQVFKLLLQSGIAPLLENFGEWRALLDQYKLVETSGIRAGIYAQWFLDGHPRGLSKVNFDQKSSVCANLVGELAAVALSYYATSTIGESPALANARSQLASETSKDLWAALAREREAASGDAIIKAYKRIMGGSATSTIANLASDDIATALGAVGDYNKSLAAAAAEVGLANTPAISVDMIRAAFGTTEE
jgi:hypothetical protein